MGVQAVRQWMTDLSEQLEQEAVTPENLFGLTNERARFFNLLAELIGQLNILLYLCPAGLIALTVALTVRSFKSFARWIGVASIFTGSLILLVLLYMQLAVTGSVTDALETNNEIIRFQQLLAAELGRSAFANTSGIILLQAAIAVVVGFVLLMLSSVVQNNSASESVIITEDGEIISTANLKTSSDSKP